MEITWLTYLIVCPLVFVGGFVDSIAGGGGLITLPAFMLAGLPVHYAIGTNKIASMMGTSVSAFRTVKSGIVRWQLALPSILCAFAGAFIGARISLSIDDAAFEKILLVVLPVCVVIVLNKKLFTDYEREQLTPKLVLCVSLVSFFLSMYDGFYGPGTGTFLLIGYIAFLKLSMNSAYSTMKLVNLSSNVMTFLVFLLNGKAVILLGIAAGLCNMLGNYLGSGLALKNGTKLVRPVILTVVGLLMIRIIRGL